MQIQQIDYIIEVAKTESISKAAENLHVSIATISQSITNFEKEFGVTIFTRSRLGTKPTPQGLKVIEKSKQIRSILAELEEETISENDSNRKLTIVSSPTPLMTIIPRVIAEFRNEFPSTDLTIEEYQDVVKEMQNNLYDIGLVNAGEEFWIKWENMYNNTLHFQKLYHSGMYVCVNKENPLSQMESVTLEDLVNQTLILQTITKPIYDRLLKKIGRVKVLFTTNNTETIKNSVAEGIGISFLSKFSINNYKNFNDERIITVPFVFSEPSIVTFGLIRSKKNHYSTAARGFIKILRKHIEKVSIS